MREVYEKFRFGLAIEDALDFDYDYEDLVFNVLYRIFRSKTGIQKIIADFHLISRGAAYDHTFGLNIPNLKNHTGKYNVYCYQGYNNEVVNMRPDINKYLNRDSDSELTIDNLRNNDIPLIISTKNILPKDGAKPGYEFSTNTANRTDKVGEWVKPCTVRLVLDIDGMIDTNKYFNPFIHVRNPGIKILKYDTYEYRFDLSTRTDVSTREFDYTNFPKMLITPVDQDIVEDYGNIDGYYSYKDVYTGFVDYHTNGLYPDTSNMIDTTDIRNRCEDNKKSESIYNDESKIMKDNLMIVKSDEYQSKYDLRILDKDQMNEYHNPNTYRLDISVHDKFRIMELKEEGSDGLVLSNSKLNYLNLDISRNSENNYPLLVGLDNNNTELVSDQNTPKTVLIDGNDFIKAKVSNKKSVSLNKERKLVLSDSTNHDISLHNEKEIYDMTLFQDSVLISIDYDLDLTLTKVDDLELNYDLDGISKPIRIESNSRYIVILTSDNNLFLINESGKKEIFDNSIIVDFVLDYGNVLILDDNNNVYGYNLDTNIKSELLESNVRKFSCYCDMLDNEINLGYGVFLYNDGRIKMRSLGGKLPNISHNNGYVYNVMNDVIRDVDIVGNVVILKVLL